MWGRRRWWHRLWGLVKSIARWAYVAAAAILPVVAMDLMTDKLRARILWRRIKDHIRDVLDWLRHLPDRLRALVVYGLGVSEYRWAQLRTRYQAGGYGEVGT